MAKHYHYESIRRAVSSDFMSMEDSFKIIKAKALGADRDEAIEALRALEGYIGVEYSNYSIRVFDIFFHIYRYKDDLSQYVSHVFSRHKNVYKQYLRLLQATKQSHEELLMIIELEFAKLDEGDDLENHAKPREDLEWVHVNGTSGNDVNLL